MERRGSEGALASGGRGGERGGGAGRCWGREKERHALPPPASFRTGLLAGAGWVTHVGIWLKSVSFENRVLPFESDLAIRGRGHAFLE